MKTLFSFLTFLIFSSSLLSAQWSRQQCGTSNTLLDIKFVNSTDGYLSEDNGKIFKTTNKGVDWVEQSSGTTDFLNSISFVDKNTGWAVGMNEGIVIKTTNGGSTWNTAASGFASELLDIQFITDQIGWTVGWNGQIWKTTNGGDNWAAKNSNTTANLWSVFFPSADTGFAVGDSVILRTTDGGENWIISYKTSEGKILDAFKSVFFVDNNYGYAVGVDWQTAETIIFHTEDGGESWLKQNSGLNGIRLQSIMFTNKSSGWAVGEDGNILSSVDGGEHWVLEQSGITDYLRAVYAIDSLNVYAVGENATILTNSRFLNLTMDWDENKANFQVGSMEQITWESENVENVNIEYSTDAGKNWILIEENYPAAVSYYDWLIPNTTSIYCKLKITDYSNSEVSDTVPSEFHTLFSDNIRKWYFTIYGDNKWEQVESPTTTALIGIKFLDNYNGIAWGPNALLETTNGGIDWEVRSTFSSKKSSFVDKNNGWIIIDKYQGYDSSVIMYTSDGGAHWKKQSSIYNFGDDNRKRYLRDISFVDDKNGWKLVVTEWLNFGYLIPTVSISKTTDGGESWENISTNFTSDGTNLNYIKFIDKDIGWCQGRLMDDPHDDYASSTIIYFTTDAGNTWIPGHSKSSYKHFWSYDYSGFSFQTDKWFSRQITEYYDQNKPNILLSKNDNNFYEATNKGPKLLYFKNSDLGWFFGESYRNFYQQTAEFSSRFICMTQDGGTSWEIQKFDVYENFPKIKDFFSLDGNVCWAVGDSGSIMRYGNIIPAETIPNITTQPVSQTVTEGETVTFTVEATCDGPLGFQWWDAGSNQWNDGDKNGRLSVVNTSNSSTLTITNANIAVDNDNKFLCEVKNLNGYPADGYWINTDTVTLTVQPPGQFTEQTSITLIGVSSSSAAWGDYDNDGDLDILLTGNTENESVSKIYRNEGNNSFAEQTSITLVGVSSSSAAWGDYDNDGDLDIHLGTRIYRNNGGNTFTDQISLIGVSTGSAAWGDYDNDGDLDIVLTGGTVDAPFTKIYSNEGNNTFTEQTSIHILGVTSSSVAWGDYDNDGNLDILLTGHYRQSFYLVDIAKVYRNNGNNTFSGQNLNLIGVYGGSGDWGDYDNDGDLDILLTGAGNFKIYRNDGNNQFTLISIPLFFGESSAAWGDYDNDGDLDIVLTGWESEIISKIYRNDGNNTFTEQTSISLTGVRSGSAVWGDYDNDGDLDILLTGYSGNGRVSKIYRNNNTAPNTLPSAPSNLNAVVNGNDVTFSWNKSTDNETPQNGLKYNLVIGTSPGGVNILSPMSDRNTGYRRVINLGNTNHDTSWTIKGLPKGQYYWSVQAVDNCFAGSQFAPEQFIDVPLPVELTSFNAAVKNADVILNWGTATEVNSYGFEVERASSLTSPPQKWQKIGFVQATGNSSSPKEYNFTDRKLNSAKYNYRLKIIDNDGTFKYSDVVQAEILIPKEYSVSQNYPNPFNPKTRIDYQLPLDSKVTIELYSIAGEKVATIISKDLSAGYYTTEINSGALNLSSGVYLYKITAINQAADAFVKVKKLMIMK